MIKSRLKVELRRMFSSLLVVQTEDDGLLVKSDVS